MTNYQYLLGRKNFDVMIGERAIPEPANNQVLVRVLACGVCGTDIHILKNFTEYTPLGHEISAIAVKTGASVTKVHAGDQVIVEDVTYCGTCENCKNGRIDLCRNMYTLQDQSGMGEYLLVHENMLVPANGIDPVAACLTEPLTISVTTYLAAHLPPEGNLVIFGIGVLGIMCAALARHYGAGKVVCVGSNPGSARNARRETAAMEMGADAVFYTSDPDFKRKISELTNKRADAVIVTSPPKTIPMAMEVAGYGTPIVTIGLDMGAQSSVQLDIDRLIFNKNSIIPVFGEPERRFPLSLKLLRNKIIDADKLITDRFSINTAASSLKNIFSEDKGVIKAVLVNKS
ncbi:MAG: alcohol dehydrogenase catalytic domain-containing protein [Clostridiaceae bacterium]